jgi:stage III sporulation protein SpoIIIAA
MQQQQQQREVELRDWETEIEELQRLVCLLPPPVRQAVEEHPEMTSLLEVIMDLGRVPIARFPSGDVKLSAQPITTEDLELAITQVGSCERIYTSA